MTTTTHSIPPYTGNNYGTNDWIPSNADVNIQTLTHPHDHPRNTTSSTHAHGSYDHTFVLLQTNSSQFSF